MPKRIMLLSFLLLVVLSSMSASILAQESSREPLLHNDPPVQVSPLTTDNLVVTSPDNIVTFEWERITDTTDICWYNIRIAGSSIVIIDKWYTWCLSEVNNNPSHSAYIEEDGVTGNMSVTHQIEGNGTVLWDIRALEEDTGEFTAFSVAQEFEIDFNVYGMTTDSAANGRGDPDFIWDYDSRASWYQLVVGIPADEVNPFQTLHNKWYEINGLDGKLVCDVEGLDPVCTVNAGLTLTNDVGTYEWAVRPWGSPPLFYGPWTEAQPLTVSFTAPSADDFTTFNAFAPIIITTTDQPAYEFNDIPDASWYNVQIIDFDDVVKHDGWYRRKAICAPYADLPPDTCQVFPSSVILLYNGIYTWKVQAWGPGGYSTGGPNLDGWSANQEVEIKFNSLLGITPTPVSPVGVGNVFTTMDESFLFEWQGEDRGTWYNLKIANNSGQVIFSQWRHIVPEQCPTNCQWVKPMTITTDGRYWWQIRAWGPYGDLSNWGAWNYFDVDLP